MSAHTFNFRTGKLPVPRLVRPRAHADASPFALRWKEFSKLKTATPSHRQEAYALAHAEGDDLLGLLAAANLLRAELSGNLVTYVVNRNINFTNICFVGCKFCAFSRGPRESDTYFLDPGSGRAKGGRGRRNSAPPKSAFRADCRTACLRFTIATFCAR